MVIIACTSAIVIYMYALAVLMAVHWLEAGNVRLLLAEERGCARGVRLKNEWGELREYGRVVNALG